MRCAGPRWRCWRASVTSRCSAGSPAACAGARHVCLGKVDPPLIWRLFEDEGITHLNGAPTVLVLFGSALGPATTLAYRDTDRLYAPVRTLVDDSLRSTRLPLWNPYECLGKPLFGEGIPNATQAAWREGT